MFFWSSQYSRNWMCKEHIAILPKVYTFSTQHVLDRQAMRPLWCSIAWKPILNPYFFRESFTTFLWRNIITATRSSALLCSSSRDRHLFITKNTAIIRDRKQHRVKNCVSSQHCLLFFADFQPTSLKIKSCPKNSTCTFSKLEYAGGQQFGKWSLLTDLQMGCSHNDTYDRVVTIKKFNFFLLCLSDSHI